MHGLASIALIDVDRTRRSYGFRHKKSRIAFLSRKKDSAESYHGGKLGFKGSKVKEIGEGKAVVRTTEYWYLRWWSTIEAKYRYPYRETNYQTYILTKKKKGWYVEDNIRPAPRTSTPHRQK